MLKINIHVRIIKIIEWPNDIDIKTYEEHYPVVTHQIC